MKGAGGHLFHESFVDFARRTVRRAAEDPDSGACASYPVLVWVRRKSDGRGGPRGGGRWGELVGRWGESVGGGWGGWQERGGVSCATWGGKIYQTSRTITCDVRRTSTKLQLCDVRNSTNMVHHRLCLCVSACDIVCGADHVFECMRQDAGHKRNVCVVVLHAVSGNVSRVQGLESALH